MIELFMNRNYLKYKALEFASDLKFVRWIKFGEEALFWNDLMINNPQLKPEIENAKKIVELLMFSEYTYGDHSFHLIASRDTGNYIKKISRKKYTISLLLKYAAVFILFLSLSLVLIESLNKIGTINYASQTISSTVNRNAIQSKSFFGDELQFSNLAMGSSISYKSTILEVTPRFFFANKSSFEELVKLTTPYGKRINVELSDGSTICLGSGSSLIFPEKFSGVNRRVVLEGEAYFEIVKNALSPFVVNTIDVDVKVLGTKFNVNNRKTSSKTEIVLVEGSVIISHLNNHYGGLEMQPLQKVTFDKNTKKTTVESDQDVNFYTSWKDGFLEFEKLSMMELFLRLSDYYNVSFTSDANLELSENITGKLELQDKLEDVLSVLEDVALLTFKIEGDKVCVSNKLISVPI
jgi:transmembrane sensor